jgi:L-alanine-DL-glutamate epimerase-like enolase superfamily enzyme
MTCASSRSARASRARRRASRISFLPPWWAEIVDGLPDPIVVDGMVAVLDRPGLGVDLIPERARRYLSAEDREFFD